MSETRYLRWNVSNLDDGLTEPVEVLNREEVDQYYTRLTVKDRDGKVFEVDQAFTDTAENAVKAAIADIRSRLGWLAKYTDIVWHVEAAYEVEKMDGSYTVGAIIFEDVMDITDGPVAEIMEDDF